MHEAPVSRRERLRRGGRLIDTKTWRSLLLGLSEPTNDPHWSFIAKSGTSRYLQEPEPWLAPGAVEFLLSKYLKTDYVVFEWGAGSSTLWFVSHGCTVTSYETDAGWTKKIRELAYELADVHHVSLDAEYVRPPLVGTELVLIDGRRRRECALHVAENGHPGLLVVLDDSHREGYLEGVTALSQRAGSQWHFPGLTAMMTPKMTSVFELG